ncbi:diguanylate cyclase [Massilia sp. W12]|uniref:GGDEF domain-containing protein n=1 Tax=Massilia sp. W12 TaxID=3126507 RepID=UPI0030CFA8DA
MENLPTTSLRLSSATPGEILLAQLQGVARIGKHLFNAANCIIRIKGLEDAAQAMQGPLSALELAFCDSIPASGEAIIAPDARQTPALAVHKAVQGAPYIRSYMMQPLFDEEHALVGSLHIIGYAVREPGAIERQLLSDLGNCAERELRLLGMAALQQDLQRKNRSLRRESMIDPLLGAWNRAAITRMLASELERCYNESKPLALILADLASWQQIKQSYGHAMSDNVLLKFTSRLRSCIRPSDALGRYEQETFLVILPGASYKTTAVIASRMRQAIITEPEAAGNDSLYFQLAMGAVSTDLYPQATLDELINLADEARLSAKKNGHNQIVQARPDKVGAAR